MCQLSWSNSPWEAYGATGLGLRTLLGEELCIHNHSELATSRADCHWVWTAIMKFLGVPLECQGVLQGKAVQHWVQYSFENKMSLHTGFQSYPPRVLGPQVGH